MSKTCFWLPEDLAELVSLRIEIKDARLRHSKLWQRFNDRRAVLIDKELDGGLTPHEQHELKELQAVADRYLDMFSPLPREDLSWLDKRTKQLREGQS